jgi:hypothetical protein
MGLDSSAIEKLCESAFLGVLGLVSALLIAAEVHGAWAAVVGLIGAVMVPGSILVWWGEEWSIFRRLGVAIACGISILILAATTEAELHYWYPRATVIVLCLVCGVMQLFRIVSTMWISE